MRRAEDRGAPGIRLLQAGYHTRSLSLYAKLGSRSVTCSPACRAPTGGRDFRLRVRRATIADIEACTAVCRRVHGHDRAGEVRDALVQGTALVVRARWANQRLRHRPGVLRPCRRDSNEDLKALIMVPMPSAAPASWLVIEGPVKCSRCFQNIFHPGFMVAFALIFITSPMKPFMEMLRTRGPLWPE